MVNDGPLSFPCRFPIKIIGHNHPDLFSKVSHLLQAYFPEITEEDFLIRSSQRSHYFAMTVVIKATNQKQLDGIYAQLLAIEQVLWVL